VLKFAKSWIHKWDVQAMALCHMRPRDIHSRGPWDFLEAAELKEGNSVQGVMKIPTVSRCLN
jgi:hypothetical protein